MRHLDRIHYLEWPGPGRPVVLVHGLTGAAGLWTAIAERLAKEGHRVLAPDLRGHGRSHKPGDYSLRAYAADLIQLLEFAGPAILVGHSLGAAVAWTAAAQRPDLVTRLVLEDHHPAANPGAWRGHQEWAEAWPRQFADRQKALDFLQHAGRTTTWWEQSLTPQPNGSWGWAFDFDAVVQTAREMYREPQWSVLRQLQMPTLLIRGERSPHLKPDVAQQMAATIPDCRLVEAPGADHWVSADAVAFTRLLTAFLADEKSPGAHPTADG